MYLITGGCGFIGSAVVARLLAEGASIRILDLRTPRDHVDEALRAGRLEFIRGDLTYAPELERAMEGIDSVIHLGARLLLCGDLEDMRRVNIDGTRHVLEAARAAGVRRVVYTSTGMLYAHTPGRATREDDPARPSGPYGQSKLEAERVCRSFMDRGLEMVILRPLFVLGAGRLGVLHILFDRIRKGRPVYLVGGGTNRFHMIGVDDLASAILLAARDVPPGVYNVGVEHPTPVAAQMSALIAHVGSRSAIRPLPVSLVRFGIDLLAMLNLAPIEPEHQRVAFQDRVLDLTKAHRIMGWQAERGDVDLLIEAWQGYLKALEQPRTERADWPDGGILGEGWLGRFL